MCHRRLQTVVLLGSPRSGTTWLQEILGGHDEIASPQETKLLHEYLAPAMRAWSRQPLDDEEAWRNSRFTGLGAVLTEEQFVEWLRELVAAVEREMIALKPSARFLLLKDPPDCRHLPLLQRVLEPTAYIHLIRDGRDVADSLMRAGRSWGGGWAPRNALLAARLWRTHVEAAQEAARSAPYLEVRYEALCAEGACTVERVLEFIGAGASEPVVTHLLDGARARGDASYGSSALKECLVWSGEVRRLSVALREPDGFFGNGGGGWQAWSPLERALFQWDAGQLLAQLGYRDRPPIGSGLGQERYDRLVAACVRTARQLAGRVGGV